jgi:hypothetical protein
LTVGIVVGLFNPLIEYVRDLLIGRGRRVLIDHRGTPELSAVTAAPSTASSIELPALIYVNCTIPVHGLPARVPPMVCSACQLPLGSPPEPAQP